MNAKEMVGRRAVRVLSNGLMHMPGMFRNLQHCVNTETNLDWARQMFAAMVGESYEDQFDLIFERKSRNWRVDGENVMLYPEA